MNAPRGDGLLKRGWVEGEAQRVPRCGGGGMVARGGWAGRDVHELRSAPAGVDAGLQLAVGGVLEPRSPRDVELALAG